MRNGLRKKEQTKQNRRKYYEVCESCGESYLVTGKEKSFKCRKCR